MYDIPEECATGTSNGALTYYLYRHGMVQPEQENVFLQGEHMHRGAKRPGRRIERRYRHRPRGRTRCHEYVLRHQAVKTRERHTGRSPVFYL